MKKCSQLDISLTIGVHQKNSLDLVMGRPPIAKSNEFFPLDPNSYRAIVDFIIEIAEKVLHILGAPPTVYGMVGRLEKFLLRKFSASRRGVELMAVRRLNYTGGRNRAVLLSHFFSLSLV